VLATYDIQREQGKFPSSITLSFDPCKSDEVKIGRIALSLQPDHPVPESVHLPYVFHGAPKMTSMCMVMNTGRPFV
jgi:hypothetical protein